MNQTNVVLDVQDSAVRFILNRHEVQEQIVLDSTGSVRRQVRVIPGIQLSRHANVVGVSDHAVDVSGTVRMATHNLEQRCRRAGGVDGVLGGLKAVEGEVAVLVRSELAAEVVACLVFRVEDIVLAVSAGLPHVENSSRDSFAGVDVNDLAVEECLLPVLGHVLDHAATKLTEWCLGGPEGPKNSRRCGRDALCRNDLVVDLVDETLNAISALMTSWTKNTGAAPAALAWPVATRATT